MFPVMSSRIWVIVGVVVVALVAVGVGPQFFKAPPAGPLAPPDGPWHITGTYWVDMKDDVTQRQRDAVIARLKSDPNVHEAVWRNEDEEVAEILKLTKDLWIRGAEPETESDIDWASDSIKGVFVDSGEAAEATQKVVDAMPGVEGLHIQNDYFWWGKADLSLWLCPQEPSTEGSGCRQGLTEEQQEAVVDVIRDTDEVEAFYFEDNAHVAKVIKAWTNIDSTVDSPRYHLKLRDPAAISEVAARFREMDGLHEVRPVLRAML